MRGSTTTAVATLALSFFAAASHANQVITLETIKVSGTKEEKNYFENPESISILQENELPGTGRENNLQILNAVPNVEVNKNGESFSIRGINNTGVTGFQKDNLSSIVIDDLFQTDLAIQSGSFDLWDMERVEILRGAQSTSQGVNSLAGTVLLNHYRPRFVNEGGAKLGLGTFWHREAGVFANQVLIPSKLSLRGSYGKEINNGYITNVTTNNDHWGRWNKDRARLGLLVSLSEKDSITLDGKFNRNDQGGTYTQGADAFKYEVAENQDFKTTTKGFQFGSTYSRILNDQLKNSLLVGYSRSDQDSSSDADGTTQNTAGLRLETHDDHYASAENRLNFKNENLSNLLGLHAHDFNLSDFYDFNLLFPLAATISTPVAVKQGVDRTRRTLALFDSFTYRLVGPHSIVGGARAEYVHSRYGTSVSGQRTRDLGAATNTAVDTYISQISGSYEGSRSNLVVLPKLGYTFATDRHFAGLIYTRGYRTAGVSINRRRASAVEYDPEFTNNYEASYKYLGDAIQISSNLFYIDWRDQQVQVQLSNDFYDSQVQNAAKSQVYGAELEGKVTLGSKHFSSLGVGYADTKFNEFTTRSGSYEGKQFPFASKWTGRISHEYKLTDSLSFLAVLRYLSDSYSNAENTRKSERQFYLNLSTKYSMREWFVEGYVNNALNGQYRIFDGTPTNPASPYQASYHQTSLPREFGVRVSYYW